MTVTVLLFAAVREKVGARQVELELPEDARVGDLRQALTERYPELAGLAPSLSVAVNQEYCADEAPVRGADEVAVIPPVSGGR